MDNEQQNEETKSAAKKKEQDPHAAMMGAFKDYQAKSKEYAKGIGVKHIRIHGDILGDHKMEFTQQ